MYSIGHHHGTGYPNSTKRKSKIGERLIGYSPGESEMRTKKTEIGAPRSKILKPGKMV